jgi:hypothetical protein
MVALLAILALAWASQQAAASYGVMFINLYNSSDCTGAILESEAVPAVPALNVCLPGYGGAALINGQPVTVGSTGFYCPAGTFEYGLGGTCNITAPLTQLCMIYDINPPISATVSCLPDICKPESRMSKATCERRVGQCGEWHMRMKWWVA